MRSVFGLAQETQKCGSERKWSVLCHIVLDCECANRPHDALPVFCNSLLQIAAAHADYKPTIQDLLVELHSPRAPGYCRAWDMLLRLLLCPTASGNPPLATHTALVDAVAHFLHPVHGFSMSSEGYSNLRVPDVRKDMG
jgi:hypothetical protein